MKKNKIYFGSGRQRDKGIFGTLLKAFTAPLIQMFTQWDAKIIM